jgi:hypothetical protein
MIFGDSVSPNNRLVFQSCQVYVTLLVLGDSVCEALTIVAR